MSSDDFEIGPFKPDSPLSFPGDLVIALATGLEEPDVVAARYGFEGRDWDQLKKWKPFQAAVQAQIAEFEKNGATFKLKAKALTEDVFEEAYKIARGNDASLLQKLEFIKLGAKLADMEPKANTQVAAGPGFSISINFSQPPKHVEQPKTIDITPNEQPELQPAQERRTLSSE